MPDDPVSHFARTNFRNDNRLFGIKQRDRLAHIHIVGKTGVGKSTLLETMISQDIEVGRGFALIDPHGDLAERVWNRTTAEQRERIAYLDGPNPTQPFGYNPLRRVSEAKIPLAASGLLETLRKLWPDAWGVRMEHILRNSLYALLEIDDARLPDILRLFRDKDFRMRVARQLQNSQVHGFWRHEFESYPYPMRASAVAPIQNKLGAMLSDPTLQRILVSPVEDLHFRSLMDGKRGLIVNLAKGQLGEDSALVLGSLLVSTIGLAAFSRAEMPEDEREPFFLYVDEFHNFTTLAFANMMSELRKYGVGLVLAHQHLNQLEPDIRHAVLGNAGTLIAFRVGAEDASFLAREFQPKFDAQDLMALANHDIYLKLMIDGRPSLPFSARTIPPEGLPHLA
ncbi:MAG TPA: TraM recognition domain-containing protein [Terriglobales bacterium]|nr:TraM recognition domain-containing protein [Terriglobales bacterium]